MSDLFSTRVNTISECHSKRKYNTFSVHNNENGEVCLNTHYTEITTSPINTHIFIKQDINRIPRDLYIGNNGIVYYHDTYEVTKDGKFLYYDFIPNVEMLNYYKMINPQYNFRKIPLGEK